MTMWKSVAAAPRRCQLEPASRRVSGVSFDQERAVCYPRAVNSCADLVDLAMESKQRAARQYADYGSRSGIPGLKPLLASLAAQENEHAAALGEIKRRANLDLVFRAPVGPMPDLPETSADPADASSLPAAEFLGRVLRNTDASIAVFSFLESHSQDRDISESLRRLAEEALRTRVMVASRHDLETLGGA